MNRRILWVAAAALLIPNLSHTRADVKLPNVIASHMVLQRDLPLPIWGWADPEENVTVRLDDSEVATVADAQGNWKVTLPAFKADGKAHRLIVTGKNKIELEDILIGEVWLGSGQSNMEWGLAATHGATEAIAAADYPQIRLFHVPKVQAPAPAKDVDAAWNVCAPDTVPKFSAVLYYHGQRLHKELRTYPETGQNASHVRARKEPRMVLGSALRVPIGLINSSWGGSPIEPWITAGGQSGGMFNGMIAPVKPFAIRGVVWYQGETNVLQKNGLAYFDKMKALIEGWRLVWGREFPFYFVQIAPWSGRYEDGQLPALWEAQVASLKIARTGMAVTTDVVDNIDDIHPRNKRDVGNRLALWALAKIYGQTDLAYSGPLYKSMTVEGNTIRLSFAHAGGGLQSRDGKPLSEFQIAGADGKFVPATAMIDGDTVVVQSPDVTAPTQVRFGWHKVANPRLINKEGLPASPFQTNNWQGGTGERDIGSDQPAG